MSMSLCGEPHAA